MFCIKPTDNSYPHMLYVDGRAIAFPKDGAVTFIPNSRGQWDIKVTEPKAQEFTRDREL